MNPNDQENDWQFWAAMLLVGIALCGGLMLFHRCTQSGRSLSVDGLAMIGTTLVAAATGFLAILYQVRSSSKQLRDQIKAQRDAEEAERERQKRAIANGILFEIDNFCIFELDMVAQNLAKWDPSKNDLPTAVGLRGNISEIYKAVSPILGSLNAKSVSAIVKFYGIVGSYDGLWRDYQFFLELLWRPANPAISLENFIKEAKQRLEDIRNLIPQLKGLATNVSNSVAQDCGLDELIAKNDAQTN